MSRWIRVSADIFEHELFAQEELSEREAWLWLVAKAAWKDTRHRIGSEVVPVPRGTMFCTLRELCGEWRWKSDFRVRSFLEMLEREGMIERNANAGKTHLTICNYDKYQNTSDDAQRKENAAETHGKRTENALKIPVYQDTKEDTSLRSVSKTREKPADLLAAFSGILTDENAKAVVEHRKAKGAKLTMRAAQLLAKAFDATGDPNAAAEMMISRGWQGFKPEWMGNDDRTKTTRSSARESVTAFADGWRQGLPVSRDY